MNPSLPYAAVVATLVAAPALAQSTDKPALAAGDSWTYRQVSDGKESFWSRRVVGVASDGGADMQIGERAFKVDASLNILDPKGPEYLREHYRSRCASAPNGRPRTRC